MKAKKSLLIITCIFLGGVAIAQEKGHRKSIFTTKTVRSATDEDTYSILSLGTMFGVSYSLKDMTTYKIRDNIVVIDKKGKGGDRLLPAVYAFPSISFLGAPGKSLSAILPVNLNPSKDVAAGIGISYGFNTFKNSAELGISLVAIWSDKTELDNDQEISFANQTPLPTGETSEFSTSKAISIGVGIYIVPLLK